MNKSELSLIERIFYPGWLMVSQLRGGQEVHDGEGLYRRACRLVQEAKIALTEAGYSDISRNHMVYGANSGSDGRLSDGHRTVRGDVWRCYRPIFGNVRRDNRSCMTSLNVK